MRGVTSQPQTDKPSPPPTPGDIAWVAAITAVKATVIALAVDAFLNSNAPRYQGKGMRLRAVGYAARDARRAGRLAAPRPAASRIRASSTWR